MESQTDENITVRSEIEKLRTDAENLEGEIRSSAESLEKTSKNQRARDVVFRSVTAVLAVASPALVAYSSTEGTESTLRLLAILLAGIAGATTTLQSIFGFKESFLRNASAALSLEQVANNLMLSSEGSESQKKDIDEYATLKTAVQTASDKYIEVLQRLKKSIIESYEQ